MSDLVKRLRELGGPRYPDDICGKQLMSDAADRIEALEAALRQAREVLNEQALDNARQMASEHRQFMASYRPSRQQALDDDVQAVEDAIATINDLLKDSTTEQQK